MGQSWTPAVVFPVAEFVQEEIEERGWNVEDLAQRAGVSVANAALLLEPTTDLVTAHYEALSRAFGTSWEYWRNLDAMWRKYPERRNIPSGGR